MDLIKLHAMGAIVPRTLFKREIEVTFCPPLPAESWADPGVPEYEDEPVTQTMTVYLRKRSSADMLEVGEAEGADRSLMTLLRSVCTPEGAPVFESIEQVRQLEPWMAIPLLQAVAEVNRYGAKKSTPRTSSGAPSPSPSAAAASRSGKKRCPKKRGRSG